jgi:prepilin-type N-terminal cleavage/methylation domain-containing protein
MTRRDRDQGFTLIELLIVIVILGILATIVVFAVRGAHGKSQDATCATEAKILETAGEAYFAHRPAMSITPVGATADRYELALVQDGVLRDVSMYYDLDQDGVLLPVSGSPCTP